MGQSKPRTWLIATVVLTVLVLVGGWFLAVSPQVAEAGDIREQTASVEAENQVLRVRNAELRRQFAQIEEMRAELAAYQTAIPLAVQLSDFIRQVDEIAEDNDVVVTSLTSQQTQVADTTVTPPAQEEEVVAEDEVDADGEAAADDAEPAEGEADPEPAPDPGGPLLENLYTVPVQITVMGSYDDVRDFLTDLQTGIDRTFYIPSLAIVAQEEDTSGVPPTEVGDIQLTVSGLAFVLDTSPAYPPEESEEPEPEPQLPSGTGYNWFVPITGEATDAGEDDEA